MPNSKSNGWCPFCAQMGSEHCTSLTQSNSCERKGDTLGKALRKALETALTELNAYLADYPKRPNSDQRARCCYLQGKVAGAFAGFREWEKRQPPKIVESDEETQDVR